MSAWTDALDVFERLLDEVDERLASGQWEGITLAEGPELPAHAPTASQRERAVALAERYQSMERRLSQAALLKRGELGELERRRDAARVYDDAANL